ncbi:MAG TPA: 1,4-alpha-glucan branching protein domain-containing protein [Armatimonadota bacterium]|jgi:1,4-alpha-glucan branching enzyme
MPEPVGCFALILHSHIPYVLGHGTWPHGSQMLYEAAADTYIPLLWMLEELEFEGIPASITISFSAITLEQLTDDRFRDWFLNYLWEKVHAAERDEGEFRAWGDGHREYLARRWQDHYRALIDSYDNRYGRDLIAQFRRHQDAGNIELMVCGATHGYLPLLHEDGSVQLQVRQAVSTFERCFGRRPRGFWLPECAYRPRANWAPPPAIRGPETPQPRKGVEEFLAENGIDYFIVDTHMLTGGPPEPVDIDWSDTLGKAWGRVRKSREPRPYYGTKSPYFPYFVGHYYENHPPVAILVRDPATGLKVWSGEHGYPGDGDYLEFHKKHLPGDLRYWRVTGGDCALGDKAEYHPEWAEGRVREHAGNFLWSVKETLRSQPHPGGRRPVLCAPFDAELFGHWWHEGPRFLTHVLRWMHQDPEIEVVTASGYLARNAPETALALPEGSWGAGGGHHVWLNPDVNWVWGLIYDAEQDFRALLADHGYGHDPAMSALVRQAERVLLLLQASDWPFLITTWSARDYAGERVAHHHGDYKRVADMARRYARGEMISEEEWSYFGDLQSRDRPFPEIEPAWFAEVQNPA